MKSQRRFAFVGFVLFLLTVDMSITVAAQTPPSVDPPSLEIRVGNTGIVKVTSTPPVASAGDLAWSNLGDVVEVVKTEMNGNSAVTTLRALTFSSTPKDIKVTVGGATATLKVTTLTSVQPGDFPTSLTSSLSMNMDEPSRIRLNNLSDLTIPSEGLVITSDNESVVTGVKTDTSIVITGHKAGTGRLTIKSNGQSIKTLDVIVTEPVASVELVDKAIISLREKQTFDLNQLVVKVTGKAQTDLKAQFPPTFSTGGSELATITGTTLTAVRAPKPNEDRPKLVVSAGEKSTSIPIQIEPLATTVNLISQNNTVAVGGRADFGVQVRNSQNATIDDATVEWTIADADKEVIRIVSQQGTQVTVEGLKAAPNGVTLRATLKNPVTDPQLQNSLTVVVKDLTPTGFTPLHIRIDLLDSQTAKDLFGKRAAQEFFISKIRLFNDLKNANGEFGDSILVYSESLEIRVQLEEQDKGSPGGWKALQKADYISLFGDPESFTPNKSITCKEHYQPNFLARYRPYTFDIVANTHDRRDERSLRSRVLMVAEGLSTLGSFVTSIAVPGAGSDLPLGLDKFKNLLIPSFEKLFPSMKEVQRQNIIGMVMRPLEEIPFGSDVTRILFIPKGKLIGMIPDKVYRIGGVSTTGACAEVGTIKKANPTQ